MTGRRALRRASVAAGATIGLGMGLAVGPSVADELSPWKSFATNGKSYQNRSRINYSGAEARIRRVEGAAPQNTMGVRSRVYYDGGTLCKASTWEYNGMRYPEGEILFLFVTHDCGGLLYGQGNTRTWNGEDYREVPTLKTPMVFE